jgi:hypothetical protein
MTLRIVKLNLRGGGKGRFGVQGGGKGRIGVHGMAQNDCCKFRSTRRIV